VVNKDVHRAMGEVHPDSKLLARNCGTLGSGREPDIRTMLALTH